MRFVVLLHQWDTHSLNIPKSHLYTFASSVHLKFIRQWRMVAAWFLQQCWPNKDNSSKSLGGFPMCVYDASFTLNFCKLRLAWSPKDWWDRFPSVSPAFFLIALLFVVLVRLYLQPITASEGRGKESQLSPFLVRRSVITVRPDDRFCD